MNGPKVDILLATRNGERFVREQIGSLLGQTYGNFRILVHDDGSQDATVSILRELADRDSRIRIVDDGIRSGSAQKNFLHLLKYSDAPRVMFCDQDDVWFPDKIEKMIKAASALPEDVPGVVYSRANYWNPEKGTLGQTWKKFPKNLQQFLTQKAAVQGSASMFNPKAREMMLAYDGFVVMHDHLLALVTYTFGRVITMPDVLMNYRQHDSNVTGNSDEAKGRAAWILSKLTGMKPVMGRRTLKAVREFFDTFGSEMTADKRRIFEEFFKLEDMSRFGRALSAFRNGFARDGSVSKLALKLLLTDYLPVKY